MKVIYGKKIAKSHIKKKGFKIYTRKPLNISIINIKICDGQNNIQLPCKYIFFLKKSKNKNILQQMFGILKNQQTIQHDVLQYPTKDIFTIFS